ncbi:hypothetical protein [Leadbetterella byssophila]|uniref:hypothetical protein n=1 Tax=Leadbetterella byssophila TaxID=316068 RepID=UPI0039A2DC7E
MTKEEAFDILAVTLLEGKINSIEVKLTSQNLRNEVKYHNEALNQSLKSDFDQLTEILQGVVDAFYFDSFVVDRFEPLFIENLDFAVKHNLSLLGSLKKVLKLIEE